MSLRINSNNLNVQSVDLFCISDFVDHTNLNNFILQCRRSCNPHSTNLTILSVPSLQLQVLIFFDRLSVDILIEQTFLVTEKEAFMYLNGITLHGFRSTDSKVRTVEPSAMSGFHLNGHT